MKAKVIIFLAISAVLTLSFTFASHSTKNSGGSKEKVKTSGSYAAAPAGGIISEDQL
jgi:hypothetical protein